MLVCNNSRRVIIKYMFSKGLEGNEFIKTLKNNCTLLERDKFKDKSFLDC